MSGKRGNNWRYLVAAALLIAWACLSVLMIVFAKDDLPSTAKGGRTLTNFDPFVHISAPYRRFARAFVRANSVEDVRYIEQRIAEELQATELVQRAGILAVFAGTIAAAASPEIWILILAFWAFGLRPAQLIIVGVIAAGWHYILLDHVRYLGADLSSLLYGVAGGFLVISATLIPKGIGWLKRRTGNET